MTAMKTQTRTLCLTTTPASGWVARRRAVDVQEAEVQEDWHGQAGAAPDSSQVGPDTPSHYVRGLAEAAEPVQGPGEATSREAERDERASSSTKSTILSKDDPQLEKK